ncbi:MAG: hypothetical protein SH848_18990 [Saprospiraceae bacterium]|nr:hypothetical protein [Saprospiraceae bacterium]MDZ4706021.1 hypothetical protein [Saprospiraceae bacterium]
MEYRELNRNTLERAIRELPGYTPEQELWTAIEAQLELEAQDKQLRIATHQLPLYSPPPQAWGKISSELEQKPKLRKLWTRPVLAIAATIFGVILSVGVWLYFSEDTGAQMVLHTTEMLDVTGFEGDWDADEQDIAMVVSMVEKMPENENLNSLKTELKELNEAKAVLTHTMSQYGKDADLIRRLSKIERERSKIVKQMAAEI